MKKESHNIRHGDNLINHEIIEDLKRNKMESSFGIIIGASSILISSIASSYMVEPSVVNAVMGSVYGYISSSELRDNLKIDLFSKSEYHNLEYYPSSFATPLGLVGGILSYSLGAMYAIPMMMLGHSLITFSNRGKHLGKGEIKERDFIYTLASIASKNSSDSMIFCYEEWFEQFEKINAWDKSLVEALSEGLVEMKLNKEKNKIFVCEYADV